METKPPMQPTLPDAKVMDRLRAIVNTRIDPGTGVRVDSRTFWNALGLLESMKTKPPEGNVFFKYVNDDLPGPGKGSERKNE